MRACLVLLFAALSLTNMGAFAQTKFEMWPGATYDPAVPTIQKVLSYAPGERIAAPEELVRYFDALAAAQPNRVKVFDYAKSWEKRRLIYAAIGSEANIKRLAEIQASMKRLADPRKTNAAEAQKLIASLPAVIMLAHGVHGNEISSCDSAMMTAYHLLAARNDSTVAAILKDVVVLIDPIQNPDGRNRFVQNFNIAEGLEPDSSPVSAERNEPWPGGRTNHYYFDMNRDWFALTQPETRGRVALLQEWFPLVFVDLHEMGTESTYFFAPGSAPFNPHLTKNQLESQARFGQGNAKYFDKFGFPYFTRETYDEFYPGYGASWPWFYGGVSMTYENASVRGLKAMRGDDTLYEYHVSVQKHFIASVATCETAARDRQRLLDSFYAYRQSAISEGEKEPIKEYLLARRGDVSSVDKLAANLAAQGVEVKRATAAFSNGGKEYPAGSYIVPLAQPAKRFVRTLLDPTTPMEDGFLREQERRRKRKLRDQIYDVTGWSLPQMFNIEAVAATQASAIASEMVKPGEVPPGKAPVKASVAYLIPWGTNAAGRFLAGALRANLRVLSNDKSFTQAGRKFPSGTLIVLVKQNEATVHDTVAKLATSTGAEVLATDSSWVEDGPDFGSNNVFTLKRPSVGILWDSPTQSSAAGHARFVIERQYGYPVTAIRTRSLAGADLSKFHVLLVPEGGGYAAELGAGGTARLKDWVSAGGTIIALGASATNFLADSRTGLLGLTQENLAKPPGVAEAKPTPAGERAPGKLITKQEEFDRAIQADSEQPDDVAGVILRATVDPEQWISAGLPATVYTVLSGRAIYAPIKLDKGVNAAVFAAPDQVLASGYLWEENRKQLAYKPLVVSARSGRGVVVAFTADPNYRAYVDGMNLFLLNAIFRGPAHTRGGAGGGTGEERHE
ncbi:MAG: peptidase M14 [Bryobacteraceae bacterium]|nr:peptidase M14 [Bryobacteraceae bacterium]